jgi:SpoVK/Ycf46/Vps4 family AAA+-type ATPase
MTIVKNNNNNNNNNKKRAFVSSTSISNYNKLLMNLDKQSNNKPTIFELTKNATYLKKREETKQREDREKQFASIFTKYNLNSSFFTGKRIDDNISIENDSKDPNRYKENKNVFRPPKLSLKMPNDAFFFPDDSPNKNDTSKNETIDKEKLHSPEPTETVFIDRHIENIDDILKIIEDYKLDTKIKYNINMKSLHEIKLPLLELKNMIGMKELKTNIVDQILYFIQDFHKKTTDNKGDFMHTVIYGPPGTGKTEIAKIIGKIYSKIGILTKGTFKKATRSDLIAGYLGQTALKTRDVINECLGGVLFIDEAYALGNSEKRDSFSKECIDTLCEALSDNKENLMVIIAGYENELNDCFFSYNQGLDSRFVWRFKTDDYKADDLFNIFVKKVNDIGWSLHETSNINVEWFKKNIDYFKFYGRDIETLLAKTKIAHSKRVFCKSEHEKTKINVIDLDKGLKMFLQNDNVKNRKEKENLNKIISSLYI